VKILFTALLWTPRVLWVRKNNVPPNLKRPDIKNRIDPQQDAFIERFQTQLSKQKNGPDKK